MPEWLAPTPASPIRAHVSIPGSKSQSNRALLLAALSDGTSTLRGVLDARDTRLMIDGLRCLGAHITVAPDGEDDSAGLTVTVTRPIRSTPWRWHTHVRSGIEGMEAMRHDPPLTIDCGQAGTIMRFLPVLAGTIGTDVRFRADASAVRRPLTPLLDALSEQMSYQYAPDSPENFLEVRGRRHVSEVTLDASQSSQFVSALLLSAMRLAPPGSAFTLNLTGECPSWPHVEMTIAELGARGITVDTHGRNQLVVHPGVLHPLDVRIEPDLSNAGPFLAAAAITGGRVTIPHWPSDTTQPGARWVDILHAMGATIDLDDRAHTLTVTGSREGIRGIDVDLSECGELAPTVAALAGCATGTSRLRGIAHVRGHETNRLRAIVSQLRAVGVDAEETEDGVVITPSRRHREDAHRVCDSRSIVLDSEDDHRMATAAAILALEHRGIRVRNAEATAKTLPGFCAMWERMCGGCAVRGGVTQPESDGEG